MTIHPLDLHFLGRPECIAAFLLESNGALALIETGPGSTLPTLTEALGRHGVAPSDIAAVLLTHIHLDHAGAAGWWARQGARVYVHERGARHLVDPAKLIAGARQVYGDDLERLWGEILPAPADHVTALREGDTVRVGDTVLTAWDTPGHARHHHVYVTGGIAFAGDVAGVRLPGESFLSPATAPSQFDPEAYEASLQRLLAARLDRLYLTHFGPVDDVTDHLTRYRTVLAEATEAVRQNLASPEEPFTALNRARAEAEGVSPETWDRYETANPSAMCAAGIRLYWERREGS